MSFIKNERNRIKQAVSRDHRKHQEALEELKKLKQNKQINSFLRCQPNLPTIPHAVVDNQEVRDDQSFLSGYGGGILETPRYKNPPAV